MNSDQMTKLSSAVKLNPRALNVLNQQINTSFLTVNQQSELLNSVDLNPSALSSLSSQFNLQSPPPKTVPKKKKKRQPLSKDKVLSEIIETCELVKHANERIQKKLEAGVVLSENLEWVSKYNEMAVSLSKEHSILTKKLSLSEDELISFRENVRLVWEELPRLCASLEKHSDLVQIRHTGTERGFGVFALQDIHSGQEISRYNGYLTSVEEYSEKSKEGGYAIRLWQSVDYYLDPCDQQGKLFPEFQQCISLRINEPPPGFLVNCKWRMFSESSAGEEEEGVIFSPVIAASREIKKGEELFIGYGRTYCRRYEVDSSALDVTLS